MSVLRTKTSLLALLAACLLVLAAGCAAKGPPAERAAEREAAAELTPEQREALAEGALEAGTAISGVAGTAEGHAEDPGAQARKTLEQDAKRIEDAEQDPDGGDEGADAGWSDEEFEDLFGDEAFGAPEEETAGQTEATISDPLEKWNRAMFQFNDLLYFALLKPVATGYSLAVPEPFRVGIKNFFYNLRFPIRFVANLLQGKVPEAGAEVLRFALNTLGGFAGLMEPSRGVEWMNPPTQDLGLTLREWGFGHGAYVVWPVLGPASVRDSVGDFSDFMLDPVTYLDPWYYEWGAYAGETVNTTSLRLGDYEALKEAALDPYTALKNAYVQYRDKAGKKGSETGAALQPAAP